MSFGNNAIISYDIGNIHKSTDFGNTWNCISKKMHLSTDLKDIYLNISGKGYIFGVRGEILKTSDKGNNWLLDTITLNRSIGTRSVSFINQDTGFLLFVSNTTQNGGILRTLNGCISFDTIFTFINNPDIDLFKIHMYNIDTGIFLFSKSIQFTSNGGFNWIQTHYSSLNLYNFSVPSNDTVFFTNLFYGVNNPPYSNPYTYLYMSTNKGYSWIQRGYFNGWGLTESYFFDSKTGYFIGANHPAMNSAILFKTTNAGAVIQSVSTIGNNSLYIFYDLYFKNLNTGYVHNYITTNGGNNWNSLQISNSHINKTVFLNDNTGFKIGRNDIILKTTDGGGITFINPINATLVKNYDLKQNYPNPFNPITKIPYYISKDSKISLIVFDVLGRIVKKLIDNEYQKVGNHVIEFNGSAYPSGIYFVRLIVNNGDDFNTVKKMVLLK